MFGRCHDITTNVQRMGWRGAAEQTSLVHPWSAAAAVVLAARPPNDISIDSLQVLRLIPADENVDRAMTRPALSISARYVTDPLACSSPDV